MQLALAEHGLSTADHGVLVALSDFGALSQQQLADRLGADKSHIVRLIDQLEHREPVTRASDPTDRRRHSIELTGAGDMLVKTVTPMIEQVEAAQFEALSSDERRTLTVLLERVVASHDQAAGHAAATT
jgi:DNA-binding MarR family transcriptional regulator